MEMFGLLASGGVSDWPIISQISWLLGQVMNAIYNVMSAIGINNIGVCIIIFTVIVYMLLMPLTIKQQKFSKMQAVMAPEQRKIQKKYEGKKDQASMLKQQEELNNLYEKYGVKMSSGCLPSLFQLIFLFGLYPVVQNIPRYVTQVREVYMPLVDKIQSVSGYEDIIQEVSESVAVVSGYDFSNAGDLAEVLYRFQSSTWNTLVDKMPQVESLVKSTVEQVSHFNNFLGIDIGEHPWNLLTSAISSGAILGVILAIIIPVLAGLTQFISVKLSQNISGAAMDNSDNPMANSMKTMTYTMPLISVFFGFSLPAGLGLYWVASAVVRSIQQVIVNKYLKSKSVEDMIEENRKKAQKKREKKGTSAKEINKMATTSTRNVATAQKSKSAISDAEKEEKLRKAQEMRDKAKPGSLTSKANLVSRYNSGQRTQLPKEESEESSKGKGRKKK